MTATRITYYDMNGRHWIAEADLDPDIIMTAQVNASDLKDWDALDEYDRRILVDQMILASIESRVADGEDIRI